MYTHKTRAILLTIFTSLLVSITSGCVQDTSIEIPTLTLTGKPNFTSTPHSIRFSEEQGLVLLSMEENGYAHLFAYAPQDLPLLRLTYGEWDDVQPAFSPDKRHVAFASNRDGYWDVYILEISSGDITRVTHTETYEGSPSWSPDGQWLAFEVYSDENLDIAILSLTDGELEPINLTLDPASDHSPAWAPGGRQLAFVSNRGGDSDIWLADLDKTGAERYVNLSKTPQAEENHPVWTTDGERLAWASSSQNIGYSGIYVWDGTQPERPARWIGDGDWPAWNTTGDQLVSVIHAPSQEYLTAYTLNGDLLLQPSPISGPIRGITWPGISLPDPLPQTYADAAVQIPPQLWQEQVEPIDTGAAQRYTLNTIPEIQAPYPQLHDSVEESFSALRQRVIDEAGWDALAGLSNAFIPLTTSLDPGLGEDWLYTGRAFALNPLISNAGWMVAQRQDYGAQTFWRLYLRVQQQDGSKGVPLHNPPWDLATRYDLDPRYYEAGGRYAEVPPGFWIEFTTLARQYGWQRLPALPNWRTYFSGARFTEFAMTGGLDWYSAMLEIYPEDILVTPTRILPPTSTPTKTPIPSRTPTSTRTPSQTPSNTPLPPTLTPTFTPSAIPSLTPSFIPWTETLTPFPVTEIHTTTPAP
jgi:TolB protein